MGKHKRFFRQAKGSGIIVTIVLLRQTKIKQNGKQLHLGNFNYKEEAQYARWCAEKFLFKDFMFPKEEPNLPEKRKQEIFELVSKKVQRLQ